MSSLMCVDVGFFTGIAYWEDTTKSAVPTVTELISLPTKIRGKKSTYEDKFDHMDSKFIECVTSYNPELIIIEGVQLHAGSAKSQASASKGDLFELAYLVGAYASIARSNNADVLIQTATQWKGQLSKQAVRGRIKRLLNETYGNHVEDAVGIGLNHLGLL